MKPYYVMIQFDGPYVNGFVVPQAENEKHAISILKRLISVRIKAIKLSSKKDYALSNNNLTNLTSYMRTLRRPWRKPGPPRPKDFIYNKGKFRNNEPVVRVVELILPVHAGHWLMDMATGIYLCNMP